MKYTLAVTSCNRFGLLQKTLDSFLSHADILPETTVILEDSAAPRPEWLAHSKYKGLGKGVWKSNGTRRGQIFSIDRLYDEVQTPYVFHLEDDWCFTRGGFMARSFDILKRHAWVSQVSLRGNDCNGHPLNTAPCGMLLQAAGWQGGWGGYSFNPGLRRMSDLKMFGGSFGNFVGYGTHGCDHELAISKRALESGYRIAVLDREPHVKHLGEGASRAIEPLPPAPRVLIAVPATKQYDYATHTSGINRVTQGRVEAVRATWMKDVHKFPNVDAAFFYGGSPTGDRQPDEIFLDCPDDYTRLPHKIQALCRYALESGYDFLVKADDDTALHVDRLLRTGFERVDQMGYFPCPHGGGRCACYAVGMCYTLSRRAMELVAKTPLRDPNRDSLYWAEDYTVGHVLRDNGIRPKGHAGWVPGNIGHYVKPPFPPYTVAAHSVTPEDMRAWYADRERLI